MMRAAFITCAAMVAMGQAACAEPEPQRASAKSEQAAPPTASNSFPFATSVISIDLAKPEADEQFRKVITDAAQARLVYLDWKITNAQKADLFGIIVGDCGDTDYDRRSQPLRLHGRPDDLDYAFYVDLTLAPEGADPYADIWCRPSNEVPVVYVRGFFYGSRREIPEAYDHVFRSVPVEPSAIPKGFLKPDPS